jgi:protein-S-isoprenylcysteine O-methyltransferase Ste14
MTARWFNWFQLATLGCLLSLGMLRLLTLYARGVHVFASDKARTPAEVLGDILTGACLSLWWYELGAYAWRLQFHVIPMALGVVLFNAVGLKAIGAAMWVVGLVVYGLTLWAISDSWRIGIDRERPGALVTGGIFGWSRNPIYLGFELCAVETFLIQGRPVFLITALILAAILHALIRREEHYLTCAYGDSYRRYRASVGRYMTWRRFRRGTSGGQPGAGQTRCAAVPARRYAEVR